MIQIIQTQPEQIQSLADAHSNSTHGLLWQVIKSYRANQRQGTVGTKTRAMVVSTGKKPYGQKKTGQARRGSFVSPLHVGGGVAHGPQMRDFRQKIPSTFIRQALAIALYMQIDKKQVAVGDLSVTSGKTKDAMNTIQSIVDTKGTTVICLDNGADLAMSTRAYRNIRGVRLVSPEKINAYDISQARRVFFSTGALETVLQRCQTIKPKEFSF
jgi:large subunit ribosomal protein L4